MPFFIMWSDEGYYIGSLTWTVPTFLHQNLYLKEDLDSMSSVVNLRTFFSFAAISIEELTI